jgi:hypothetical protein
MTDNNSTAEGPVATVDSLSNVIDVIYHNIRVTSTFRTLRQTRYRTVEEQLQILTHQIQAGCFDTVISVSASKGTFVVVGNLTLKR